jgi:hypothetical protein
MSTCSMELLGRRTGSIKLSAIHFLRLETMKRMVVDYFVVGEYVVLKGIKICWTGLKIL